MRISRFLLVFVIISLMMSALAFADDPEPVETDSGRLATQEELEDLDARLMSTSELIYNTLSENGTKATSYTTTDIYNWLNNYLGTDFQNHGSTYPALMYARINSINTRLTSFNNLFSSWDTWINNISNNSTSIYLLLDELIDSINPDYQTVGISIYDLLHSISTALTSIDGDDGDLTLIETLVYMYNELEDMNTTLSNLLNSSYSVDNRLVTIYTYLTSFRSDMNAGFSNVNANMQLIITRLQNMHNDFNNILWLESSSSYLGYKINFTDNTYLTNQYTISGGSSIYLFYSSFLSSSDNVYKISIRIRPGSSALNNSYIKNISVIRNNNSLLPGKYSFEYDANYQYLNIYFYDGNLPNDTFAIKIDFNTSAILYSSSNQNNIYYINSDSIDYYFVYYYLSMHHQNNIFTKFEQLYASDDLISSKEEQQPLENQILEDFTGNGSASATVGDAVNIKQASNAIKEGLNTGANSGLALDYAFGYNNPSGLFVWFTQQTKDYFTLYTPTRSNPNYSDIIWTDEVPDLITNLDRQYQNGLNND